MLALGGLAQITSPAVAVVMSVFVGFAVLVLYLWRRPECLRLA
jgi:hypothetical protein